MSDISTAALRAETAPAWCREPDQRRPLRRDIEAERKALVRDFIDEALRRVSNDLDAAFLTLVNDDDVGAVYHFKRVIKAVKTAAHGFRDLAS
jgi:hypothetical protein